MLQCRADFFSSAGGCIPIDTPVVRQPAPLVTPPFPLNWAGIDGADHPYTVNLMVGGSQEAFQLYVRKMRMFDSRLAGLCVGYAVPPQLRVLLQDDLDKRSYAIDDEKRARAAAAEIDKQHFRGVFLPAFDKAVATHKIQQFIAHLGFNVAMH